MREIILRFVSTLSRKWALVGMFVSTLLLSISIEVLSRVPTTPAVGLGWEAGLLIVSNVLLIPTALGFVWIAAKTAIQHLMLSVVMIGTLVTLLGLYSVVFLR